MSALAAVVHVGEAPPLGAGLRPEVVAHLYGGTIPRFLVYEREGDDLARVPGAYAPDLDADPAHPVTDLLLATRPEWSAAGQRLRVLSRKAEANYGATIREKVLDSDTAAGTEGYGRHFEARSQLEAHPYEGVVAVGVLPAAGEPVREALLANLDRLDAAVEHLGAP